MSHTNTTANYNLPQFVGTDKPSWLTDVNGAMSSIDTQMKANADANTTTAGDLTTLAGRVTTAEGNITTQGSTLSTVSNVASNASVTATSAKATADALSSYLTFTSFDDITSTISGNGVSIFGNNSNLMCAKNADGSLGKIYGSFEATVTSSRGGTISFTTGLRPSSQITINGASFITRYDTELGVRVFTYSYTVNTNGVVTITMPPSFYNLRFSVNLVACLLFLQDFGDTPIEG